MRNREKLILILMLEIIFPFLLLWILITYSGNWSLELTQFTPMILNLFEDKNLEDIRTCLFVFISVFVFIVNLVFTYYYKQKIKKILDIIPDRFRQFIKSYLLSKIDSNENTYSLFHGFKEVNIEDISDTFRFKNLSLNGLVGTSNQEDVALTVTDKQIEIFLSSILSRVQSIKHGKGHLFKNETDFKSFINIFDPKKIRNSIIEVEADILSKENTFKFIADQFGIFDIKRTKDCLKIEVFKTTYFTFRVMNKLYSKENILESLAERFCKNIDNETIRKEGFQALFPFFSSLGLNIILELISNEKGEGFLIQKRNSSAFGNASQYHISVNETFSFTDIDKMGKPLITACVLRGIEEEIGVNLSVENAAQRISYLDVFLNPKRGSIGLSLAYNTDINPSFISYYPGVDKPIEATKHLYIYDIHNYKQMINFLSLFNWIIYTPFLLKRYIICKQSSLNTLSTAYNLHKGVFWSIILYYVSNISIIGITTFFYLNYKNMLAGLLLLPIFNLLRFEISNMHSNWITKRKKRKANIDMASPGEHPFSKDVILYTGMDECRNLEANKIVLALKSSISIPKEDLFSTLKKEYNYDFSDCIKNHSNITHTHRISINWDTINILEHEAGIRHVLKNEEYPTLILKGHITSSITNKAHLYIREYAIDSENDLYRIGFNIVNDKEIKFGFDHPFRNVFNMENQCHLSIYAINLLKSKGYMNLKELKINPQMSGINLFDVYKSSNKDSNSIIISAKRQETSVGVYSQTLEATKEKLAEELCKLIDMYKTNKLDILMFQQILIRKDIYLFKKKTNGNNQ